MSNRTSIRDQLVTLMKQEISADNPTVYHIDLDKQVFGKQLFLSDIETFPAVTVGLGPEVPNYKPGGFRWLNLDLYIRIYVRSDDASDEQLEKIIEDVKTFIDLHEEFQYDIRKPGVEDTVTHQVTSFTFRELTTDEGVLAPYGVAEMLVTVLYDERNVRFRNT